MLIAVIQERYGHVKAERFRLSTSKTDGTHCSKTLKRCLKIFECLIVLLLERASKLDGTAHLWKFK